MTMQVHFLVPKRIQNSLHIITSLKTCINKQLSQAVSVLSLAIIVQLQFSHLIFALHSQCRFFFFVLHLKCYKNQLVPRMMTFSLASFYLNLLFNWNSQWCTNVRSIQNSQINILCYGYF